MKAASVPFGTTHRAAAQENQRIKTGFHRQMDAGSTSAGKGTEMEFEYKTVTSGVSAFWRGKYEEESGKHWDKFYQRNGDRFFKDRHWTSTEATDGFSILSNLSKCDKPLTLLEVGCGVGNTIIPLLEQHSQLSAFAFDVSKTAVGLTRRREGEFKGRLTTFVWDGIGEIPNDTRIPRGLQLDGALLIFVLSAVAVSKHVEVIKTVAQIVRPGGRLMIRDYCDGDLAQRRFKNRNRIEERYYVRQDGTLTYFFDEEYLGKIVDEAAGKNEGGSGLKVVYARRVGRHIENKKEGKKMDRIFLQAEIEKC